jgi:glucuronyl/N-acetylglucosaminyl transferase EXT2
MVAGAGFSSWTYRLGFDVSLPVYSPLVTQLTQDTHHKFARYHKQSCTNIVGSVCLVLPVHEVYCDGISFSCSRPWLVVSGQINLHPEYERELWHMAQEHSELLLLEACAGSHQGNYSLRCRGREVFHYPQVLQVQ